MAAGRHSSVNMIWIGSNLRGAKRVLAKWIVAGRGAVRNLILIPGLELAVGPNRKGDCFTARIGTVDEAVLVQLRVTGLPSIRARDCGRSGMV